MRFAKHFGNKNLKEIVCFICAARHPRDGVMPFEVTMHDHGALLSPRPPHPAQVLHYGMLLHLPAVKEMGICSASGDACVRCSTRLENGETPPFALANSMWIGDVPPPLSKLGLIERIIVARCVLPITSCLQLVLILESLSDRSDL